MATRSTEADTALEVFLDAIRATGTTVYDMAQFATTLDDRRLIELTHRLGQADRRVFLIAGSFVNIHVSTSQPGFWGVDPSVREDFDALSKNSFATAYVFLRTRADIHVADGYVSQETSVHPHFGVLSN
jgi:hypothetical protein